MPNIDNSLCLQHQHTLDSIIIHLVAFELELVCLCVTEQQAPASALPTQTAVGEIKAQDNIYLGGGSCSGTVSRRVQSDTINTGTLNNVAPDLIQHRSRHPSLYTDKKKYFQSLYE